MVFAVVGGYISLENVAPLLCKIFIMREFAFILSISSRNLPVSYLYASLSERVRSSEFEQVRCRLEMILCNGCRTFRNVRKITTIIIGKLWVQGA